MQYPDGWLESQKEKERLKEAAKENMEEETPSKGKRGRKRKKEVIESDEETAGEKRKERKKVCIIYGLIEAQCTSAWTWVHA